MTARPGHTAWLALLWTGAIACAPADPDAPRAVILSNDGSSVRLYGGPPRALEHLDEIVTGGRVGEFWLLLELPEHLTRRSGTQAVVDLAEPGIRIGHEYPDPASGQWQRVDFVTSAETSKGRLSFDTNDPDDGALRLEVRYESPATAVPTTNVSILLAGYPFER